MKHFIAMAVAVALAFATVSAYAQRKDGTHGKTAGATPAVKAPLEEMTLTGKIAQTESTKTGKDGVEVKTIRYTLTGTDGSVVNLGNPTKVGTATLDLAKYVGKDVKIVGQGRTETSKAGKKSTHIASITTIEEVQAPPLAAAPAADPAAK